MRFIVTGGAGFFGSVLASYLTDNGHEVTSIDRLASDSEKYRNIELDITNRDVLIAAVRELQAASQLAPISCIFHVAALLAHDKDNLDHLWASNVDGTRNVLECARQLGIKKVIFTSTNCVFSTGFNQPVDEETPVNPIETYGRSKLAAEKIVEEYKDVSTFVIRCPTIITAGRLGLLTILFDFVREGRRLYLVGDGSNRYTFIAAEDLANACLLAAHSPHEGIYHIGSDNVPTMHELYTGLMHYAGKTPKLVCIPEGPTVATLKLLNAMNLSPLGPYHYRMLAANFVFDNRKIKQALNWAPTRTNTQILCDAYKFYIDHYDEINNGDKRSAHKSRAKAGILNLVRLFS